MKKLLGVRGSSSKWTGIGSGATLRQNPKNNAKEFASLLPPLVN